MQTFALTLDLRNEPELIAAYIDHHRAVWPEVEQSIGESGILSMEIFQWGNRLFMYLKTTDDFSFAQKAKMDANNPRVQAWETLMDTFQSRLPGSAPSEKWVLMDGIYDFRA